MRQILRSVFSQENIWKWSLYLPGERNIRFVVRIFMSGRIWFGGKFNCSLRSDRWEHSYRCLEQWPAGLPEWVCLIDGKIYQNLKKKYARLTRSSWLNLWLEYAIAWTTTKTDTTPHWHWLCRDNFAFAVRKTPVLIKIDSSISKKSWSYNSGKSCDDIMYDPTLLQMQCSDGNKFESACNFSCPNGFYATDDVTQHFISNPNTTCDTDSDGTMYWTRNPPACVRKTCPVHS